ncbi:hypothetical protein HHK36_011029 [Tetracentron sinense]|uniref:Ribosomal RNA methyltransferase FtsJ domain-containing protein n=1 Tax=Tetracentron sinense TaxID=13715 RepID=A0A834ZFF7_TETSI|nr:hypothetical protein HHK36_011029 [Tetracentron sinense]
MKGDALGEDRSSSILQLAGKWKSPEVETLERCDDEGLLLMTQQKPRWSCWFELCRRWNSGGRDMCPLVSGITTKDAALSIELGMQALDLAVGGDVLAHPDDDVHGKEQSDRSSSGADKNGILRPGGNLVIKLLESEDVREFGQTCKPLFRKASWLRPKATRSSSREIYLICQAAKWIVNLLLSPFFWMYFSWTWLFWPWFLATALAIYSLYCFHKHSHGEASIFEQLVIVTSTFTWLTLVPPAHFNGYLEGWPFVFFFVYHYFFFFNVSVRKRLYGDYYPRPHDPKWDVSLPNWYRILFCAGVMAGHWLAALEGPELHLIPGGWSNVGIWVLIMVTLFTQYNSTLYLANYSEKVVVPTAVVQFGPYRWVRHPIYSSTMLLFATYCIALRAPLSLLFVIAVCLMYYDQKAKLEEGLMAETFGERYMEYMSKVKYKFIPLVY